MFSGYSLKRHEIVDFETGNDTSKLDNSLSTREEAGIFGNTGGFEMYSHEIGKDDWLEQVNGKRERYMFQEAQKWKNSEVSEEVKLNGQERHWKVSVFVIIFFYYTIRTE